MNINKSPQPLQINLPKSFWTKKSVTSKDLSPSSASRSCGNNEFQSHKILSPSQRKPFLSNTSTAICPTHQQNKARYSCTRCLLPFCSVKCYRNQQKVIPCSFPLYQLFNLRWHWQSSFGNIIIGIQALSSRIIFSNVNSFELSSHAETLKLLYDYIH